MTKKSKEDIHYKKNKANKKTKSNNVSARKIYATFRRCNKENM